MTAFYQSSSYSPDTAGLAAAEAAAAGVGAAPDVRAHDGAALVLDSHVEMTSTLNPRVPFIAGDNGRLVRAGTANMTFFNAFQAGRNQVFVDWPAANLSFLRGTHQFPEWHASAAAFDLDAQPASQIALTRLNYSTLEFGSRNYRLGAAGLNLLLTDSFNAFRGEGPVRTNFEMTNGATSSFLRVFGAEGASVARTVIEGFTTTRPVTATGGNGIDLTWAHGSIVRDIQLNGFFYGVAMYRATNTKFHDVTVDLPDSPNGVVGFVVNGDGPAAGALGCASSSWDHCAVARPDPPLNEAETDFAYPPGTGTIGWWIYGEYCGDLIFNRVDTVRMDTGILLDLTYTKVNSNGNADIIIKSPILDYFTESGLKVAGNTDNRVMVRIQDGWLDPRPGKLNARGIWLTQTRGIEIEGCQHGIGHATLTPNPNPDLPPIASAGLGIGVLAEHSKDIAIKGGKFKDCRQGIIVDSCADMFIGAGASFDNAGGAPALQQILIKGTSKRITVDGIVIGDASEAGHVIVLEDGTVNCDITLPKVDMTNIGQLISNAGTSNRFRINGPATLLTDTGTDTYLWCDPTGYTPAAEGAGATVSVAVAAWTQAGKLVTVEATLFISGALIGPVLMQLPKAFAGPATGVARNATTGAMCQAFTSGTDKVAILSPSNGTPGGDGDQFILSFAYRVL